MNNIIDLKIIYPNSKHKYTFILLHSMYSDYNSFNSFLKYFKLKSIYREIFNNIKFIIPNSPVISLHVNNNTIPNVKSWYDYFTFNNGICKYDNIGIMEFNYQSEKIANIIKKEFNLLSNSKNIYIIGVSQGGTLTFNILNLLPFNIGGIICINSIYMHKYIKLNIKYNKTPIFIYSLLKDEIYPHIFQKKTFKILSKKKFILKWFINNINKHSDINIDQYDFIINSIFN